MKTRRFWLMMAIILSFVTRLTLWAQDDPKNKTKDVMKFKLHYAQRVLEGIATENFEVMAENAKKLKSLSQQAGWQIRQTVEYQKLTADFIRHAETLRKAAVSKNVDAATVAYFQLTVSCTTCHRYLRGEKATGSIRIPEEKSAAFLTQLDSAIRQNEVTK